MFERKTHSFSDISLLMIIFFIVFYVLYIGASFIIPFIIALLLSFSIIGLSDFYNRKLRLPSFLSFILSLFSYIFLFWLVGKLINSNIPAFLDSLPEYQIKIYSIFSSLFEFFNIPEPTSLSQVFSRFNFQDIFSGVFGAVASIFSSAGIIFFYVIFILLEYRFFRSKINLMISSDHKKEAFISIIDKIRTDIKAYFVIKSIVSLITAILSYIVMKSFGLDFAIFWAFLVFVLNFIPSLGSVIAVFLPSLFALIQFDSYYFVLFMSSFLVGIQILMGNIIEPKFMGNKLNLSPLVIIISLTFWGTLWGVVGMLLSVPIMVIINIILAKIPATRGIAILLSEKGELDVEPGEFVIKNRKRVMKKIKEKLKFRR